MKITLLAVIPALTGLAAATPAKGYHLAMGRDNQETASTAGMTFTGPLRPGGPNVTYTGTAESIHHQIHEANPDYNPWDFPEYTERMKAKGITQANKDEKMLPRRNTLGKRAKFECDPAGDPVGNWPMQCLEGTTYLTDLNGYCSTPGGSCTRVSCSHSCAIHLCNDNKAKSEVYVWCDNIAGDVYDIIGECAYDVGSMVSSVKGQVFREGPPKWNTIVNEEDC